MPVDKDPKLGQYIDAFKQWLPTVRLRLAEWWQVCRAEPILFWHTPAVRFTAYGLGGMVVVWLLTYAVGLLSPGGPDPVPRAETADFHVICSDPGCGHEFVVQRPFGFHRFPVPCPKCKKRTGERGQRCFSTTCAGRWVLPARADGTPRCPRCGAVLADGD